MTTERSFFNEGSSSPSRTRSLKLITPRSSIARDSLTRAEESRARAYPPTALPGADRSFAVTETHSEVITCVLAKPCLLNWSPALPLCCRAGATVELGRLPGLPVLWVRVSSTTASRNYFHSLLCQRSFLICHNNHNNLMFSSVILPVRSEKVCCYL